MSILECRELFGKFLQFVIIRRDASVGSRNTVAAVAESLEHPILAFSCDVVHSKRANRLDTKVFHWQALGKLIHIRADIASAFDEHRNRKLKKHDHGHGWVFVHQRGAGMGGEQNVNFGFSGLEETKRGGGGA